MVKSDLLVSLVRASVSGDKLALRTAVEALIADERSKQHTVLADRLTKALHASPTRSTSLGLVRQDVNVRPNEFLQEVYPRRRLEDLLLPAPCIAAISQVIEEQSRADVLRSHSLQPRHKILLVGPPGNGKTSLAEAVAESLAVPLFIVRYDAIIGSFLGETATRLRKVFEYARTTPCVLFFDEFDAVGKERGDLHETGEIKRVVTSLLMQIDDLPSYTTVIAATNHEELLDRAAWRRFEVRISLPQPTTRDLQDYVHKFFHDRHITVSGGPKPVAKKLGNVSYAEAEQFLLNVLRRQVLGLGSITIDRALSSALSEWTAIRGMTAPQSTSDNGKAVPTTTPARSSNPSEEG